MTFFLLIRMILNTELIREHRKLNMIDYIQDFDCGKFAKLELLMAPDE